MTLPPLPPELAFEPLLGGPGAEDFVYEVKRAALGPHVAARWGWDDAFQRELHRERFADRSMYAVVRADERVGTLSFEVDAEHATINEFYLFPEHQGQGIGSAILAHVLDLEARRGLPVRLQYLKWNPVGTLYRRHGFVQIGETDTHYLMEQVGS